MFLLREFLRQQKIQIRKNDQLWISKIRAQMPHHIGKNNLVSKIISLNTNASTILPVYQLLFAEIKSDQWGYS